MNRQTSNIERQPEICTRKFRTSPSVFPFLTNSKEKLFSLHNTHIYVNDEISVKQQIIKSEIISIIIRQPPEIILIEMSVKHNISGRTPN